MSQPLATFQWQSRANALWEKAAHLLALYTLQHNKATSWAGLVRHIRSCSNCDKQCWAHTARPWSWQSLGKAWLLFSVIVLWPEFKVKNNPETTNQPKMSYWNQMPFLVLHILLFYWCSLKDPVSLTWNFQYEWIWNVTQDFMNHMCLISAFFSLFWFPVSAKI